MGYLITVLLLAVPTFFALVAPHRTPPLARASFWMGIALNELPLYPMMWMIAATALARWDATLVTTEGRMALPVAGGVVAALMVILARGLAARGVLAEALREAGFSDGADRVRYCGRPARVLGSVLVPFAVRASGVRHRRNIRYGEYGRRNLLDVYSPVAPHPGAPVLVYFHGGGYFSGRKDKEARLLLYRLARQGWVCVSANYRLRPTASFDDHLTDFEKVLAWTADHAAEYDGDAGRVVLAGSSAGAHLISVAALAGSRHLPNRFGRAPMTVDAVVCFYGYYGYYYGLGPDSDTASCPGALVHPDAPPFLIVHGEHDTYVPVAGARTFARQLREASNSSVVYAELPGAQHSFDLFRSPRFLSVVDAVEVFLSR